MVIQLGDTCFPLVIFFGSFEEFRVQAFIYVSSSIFTCWEESYFADFQKFSYVVLVFENTREKSVSKSFCSVSLLLVESLKSLSIIYVLISLRNIFFLISYMVSGLSQGSNHNLDSGNMIHFSFFMMHFLP